MATGARIDDEDLGAALFLDSHPSWRPEDLGYPRGDYVLFELLRLIVHYRAQMS